MGTPNVWILGGYQSDFARNFTREGDDFADLTAKSSTTRSRRPSSTPPTSKSSTWPTRSARCSPARAISARCPPASTTGYGTPPRPDTKPHAHPEASRRLAALADLRSGAYRTALVVGVELEKTVPGDTAAQHLGAAAWTDHEGADAKFMWPYMFDQVANEYDRRYGIDEAHLRAIAQLNFANARANPNAQTRDWTVPDPLTADDANPLDRGPVAAVRLQPDDRRRRGHRPGHRRLPARPSRACGPIGRIDGWGHRTVGLGLQQKLDRSADDPYVLPHVRAAVLDAFDRAQVTLDDVDGFEVHDCFTPSEYLAIDHIGLTGPGESWKAIENGEIEIGGRLPINPSGGLIGGGHPVGASGVRMLVDAAKQVSGAAGDYQVEGAKTFGTLELRRQHRHHRQLRRERGVRSWTSRSSASSCPRCPRTTTIPTGPARGVRRPPSGTPTT